MLQYRASRAHPPRRRILALVVGAGGLVLLVIAGTVMTVLNLTHPDAVSRVSAPATTGRAASEVVDRARDELAAKPMPNTGTGDEYGYPDLSTRDPGPAIVLPRAQGTDALGVSMGYPRTGVGALAQLAAVDQAAFQSASLPGVRAVISAWAAPGGPSATTWSGVQAMAGLLANSGLSGAGSSAMRVDVTPAMGLIKGMVGTDFAVVCVDLRIDVNVAGASTSPAVDCQRMLWTGTRWVIGPGPEPAQGVSVWPGTDAAITAGYRDLTRA